MIKAFQDATCSSGWGYLKSLGNGVEIFKCLAPGSKDIPGSMLTTPGGATLPSRMLPSAPYNSVMTVPTTSNPAMAPTTTMGLLDIFGDSSGTATGPGATTSIGGSVGSILGSVTGIPVVGDIATAVVNAYTEPASMMMGGMSGAGAMGMMAGYGTTTLMPLPGRATVGAGFAQASVGGRMRRPRAVNQKARALTRLVGVGQAAMILGLSVEETALRAVKPRRARGISAAQFRNARRVLHKVSRLYHQLPHRTSRTVSRK